MDIRQMRHVMAIHQAGSFARAADDLGPIPRGAAARV